MFNGYFGGMNVRDEVLDFLVGNIPIQALADFQPSEGARRRIWTLIEKEK